MEGIRKRLTEHLLYEVEYPYEILIDLPGVGLDQARYKKDVDLSMWGLDDGEIEIVQLCRFVQQKTITKEEYTKKVQAKAKEIRERQGLNFGEPEKLAKKPEVQEEQKEPKAEIKTETKTDQAQQIVKKINGELKTTDSGEALEIFDILDNDQIIKYMQSALAQEYFYEFPIEGKPIIGISYAGTLAVARALSMRNISKGLGGLEVLADVQITETDDSYRANVGVKDNATGFIVRGFATAPKKKKVWIKDKTGMRTDWTLKDDPFAINIAVSKATRNALRYQIPEQEILVLYKEWQKSKQA